jgi:hypothetical protein
MTKNTEHEQWHPNVFLQNKWTMRYRSMIEKAKAENRIKVQGEHSEHHIVPESFFAQRNRPGPPGWLPGNPDDPSNLVILTHREHAQAHIWLWERMTEGGAKHRMAVPIMMLIRRAKSNDTSLRISVTKLAKLMRDVAMNNRDFTIRNWANRDGRVFTGTRYDLEIWDKLPRGSLMALTCASPKRTLRGWWIVHPDEKQPPIRARYHDEIIRTWIHKDGRTFTGTRLDLEEFEKLPYRALKHLVGPKARRTSHGWQIVQPTTSTENEKIK